MLTNQATEGGYRALVVHELFLRTFYVVRGHSRGFQGARESTASYSVIWGGRAFIQSGRAFVGPQVPHEAGEDGLVAGRLADVPGHRPPPTGMDRWDMFAR